MSNEEPLYVLHCNSCPYKRHTNGCDLDDLYEVKTVDLQRRLPVYDERVKKTVTQTNRKRKKIFRCPKCGFTMKAFLIPRNQNEQTDWTDGSQAGPA